MSAVAMRVSALVFLLMIPGCIFVVRGKSIDLQTGYVCVLHAKGLALAHAPLDELLLELVDLRNANHRLL